MLDRAMVLAGETEANSFADKVRELRAGGVISQQEKDQLLTLTDAGSAAALIGCRGPSQPFRAERVPTFVLYNARWRRLTDEHAPAGRSRRGRGDAPAPTVGAIPV